MVENDYIVVYHSEDNCKNVKEFATYKEAKEFTKLCKDEKAMIFSKKWKMW